MVSQLEHLKLPRIINIQLPRRSERGFGGGKRADYIEHGKSLWLLCVCVVFIKDYSIPECMTMTIKEVTKLLIANRYEEALKALELTDEYWTKRDKKDPIICLLLAFIKAKLGKSSEDFIKDFAFGITMEEDYSEYLKMYDFGIPKD